jgi:uncharacterized protein (TIGR02271 family)
MVLHKLEEFDPNYRESLDNQDIKGLEVYRDGTDEKIGTVRDALVDDEGRFRYLMVDLGFWIFGKKVLLPIGRTRIEYPNNRVYAIGLTRKQAENLPDINEQQPLDRNQEEQVRSVYRNLEPASTSASRSATTQAFSGVATTARPTTTPSDNLNNYSYEQEPDLFELNEQNHQTLRLYQERLIANKRRQKIGEVTVGKRVEVDTARVAVPIEKERVVIEHTTPVDAGRTVPSDEGNFRAEEVARVELYEETPEIRKEAFVREEVKVTKVVDHQTVESLETVRREQLDVDAQNLPVEER